ncbi:hypothetical protein AKJ16_DCAP03076 [Drosera capensis]
MIIRSSLYSSLSRSLHFPFSISDSQALVIFHPRRRPRNDVISPCAGASHDLARRWLKSVEFFGDEWMESPRGRHVLAPRRRKSECRTAMAYDNEDIVISISHGVQQDLLPPLVSALKAAAYMNAASFHFPGHNRGHTAPSSLAELIGKKPFLHDLPELPDLDKLFAPEEPILEAQKLAAELFWSSADLVSCWRYNL